MQGRAARRALVERELVRQGGEVNKSALARELGVSRWTIRNDIAAIAARWGEMAAGNVENLDGEWALTTAGFEMVARQALEAYLRLSAEGKAHNAAVGYLRTVMDALERRARLLGLAAPEPVQMVEGERVDYIIKYEGPAGQLLDMEPWRCEFYERYYRAHVGVCNREADEAFFHYSR